MSDAGNTRWDKGLMPLMEDGATERHREITDGLRLDLKIASDGHRELRELSAEEICRSLQGTRGRRGREYGGIYSAAAAVWCHELYFRNLVTGDRYPSLPQGASADRLRRSFGTPGNFFYLVRTIAGGTAAPGFLWLYERTAGRSAGELGLVRLPLYTLPELREARPLMCIDLWEHAYMDRWGRDISGYADGYLRQTDWEAVFGG